MIRRDPSFAELEQAVEASIVVRALARGGMVLTAAARRSRVIQAFTAATRTAQAHPLSERLQFLGVVSISFAAAYLLLTAMMPESSAPAFPAFVWGPAAAIGAGLLAVARRVASAADQKNIA